MYIVVPNIYKHDTKNIDCLNFIANTFVAAQGYNVGKSLYEADLVDEAKKIASETSIPEVIDVVCGKEFL